MGSSEYAGNSTNASPEVREHVVVYASDGCPRCRVLKEWMKKFGVGFKEKDLGDADVMTDLVMRDLYILSAPALEVKGSVYREDEIFDAEGIAKEKLLEILDGELNGAK
jgi:hypothetical protein